MTNCEKKIGSLSDRMSQVSAVMEACMRPLRQGMDLSPGNALAVLSAVKLLAEAVKDAQNRSEAATRPSLAESPPAECWIGACRGDGVIDQPPLAEVPTAEELDAELAAEREQTEIMRQRADHWRLQYEDCLRKLLAARKAVES